MTLEAFRKVLDKLSEPVCCEGMAPITERLAIALPDGDLGALDDPGFVKWLVAHGEIAPFGHGGKTVVDTKVRQAHRLVARGKATVGGFDPTTVLGDIEAALSPREHLEATLTDVLVYPAGGHFAQHKDTPRDTNLVGTLVVGLPIEHTGGSFHIADEVIDWSGKPDPSQLRWVALFGDVDHEVRPVTAGSRVTLVYSLSRSNRLREDPKRAALMAKLRDAIELPSGTLMIACARQVIAETANKGAVQSIDTLRGFDRDIADVLVAGGFDVVVRPCVFASESESTFDAYSIARLQTPIPPKVLSKMDSVVTFSETADCDGEDMTEHSTCLGPYILDQVAIENWVIRRAASATLIHEAEMFSDDGYFGNEGYAAHIYTLAALEVTRGKGAAKKPPAAAKKQPAPAKKKPAAKKPPAKKKPAAKKKKR